MKPLRPTEIRRRVEVKAPIEKVFETVSDLEKYETFGGPSFCDMKIEKVTKDPIGNGTTWLFKSKLWGRMFEWNSQIVKWDPPTLFVSEQTGLGPFKSARWEHRLAPSNGKKGAVTYTLTMKYELAESMEDKTDEVRALLGNMYGQVTHRMKQYLESGITPTVEERR